MSNRSQSVSNILCFALNVSTSIGIVITNKILFEKYNFRYGTFLTFFHFLCTALGLGLMLVTGFIELKKVQWIEVLKLSSVFCASIVLTNLSLVHNSVGFYQLAKVMTTPAVVLIQSVIYNANFSRHIKLSVLIVCFGVAVASTADVSFNWIGTLFAFLGVVTTSFYQIWVGSFQKALNVNSLELLAYQAPVSCVLIIPVMLGSENLDEIANFPWTPDLVVLICMTGICALMVNVSVYLIIGKTSAVTYNIVSHFKTCSILVLGFVVFNAPLNWRNISGIIITLSGIVAYSVYKLQENKQVDYSNLPKSEEPVDAKDQIALSFSTYLDKPLEMGNNTKAVLT